MWQNMNKALRVTPPKDVWAQAVDGTSRGYDITGFTVNGNAYNPNAHDEVFVSIYADGNDIFLQFNSSVQTINDATVVAAGGAPAYATTSCFTVPKGTEKRFCITRNQHTTLMLKCAGASTATARIYFSSENDYIARGS